ncbi:unnamed protein product [Arabis nemorensis]|uniref:KIB1-4 beta-propeller domain-containing protein n=1 Tax=Arabis nemorensis TaxID=586526 RepID=A0A565CHN4_9BRAS|nr:unnamed protein product [Arabis nemorensis]
MSQFLVRIAKISSSSIVKKKQHGLCFNQLRSLSTAATPYLLFKETDKYEMTLSCEPLVELNLYDPRKDETVTIPDQTLTKELLSSTKEGSSGDGWLRGTHTTPHCISPTCSTLVPLLPHAKLSLCLQLTSESGQSLSRPRRTKKTVQWPPSQPVHLSLVSHEEYNGPVDLVDTSSGFPQMSLYRSFPFSDIPQSRLEQVYSTSKSQHIVESPSGESFIVHWFNEYLNKEEIEASRAKEYQSSYTEKPKGFVVFRQDPEQKMSCYTEDIGDLCIFLGKNEAFCVSATEYPGLKPNSIYFANTFTGFGLYDLSSNTLHDIINRPPYSCRHVWLAPL